MNAAKKIYLVDDHPLMQEGLTRSLEKGGQWEVCGYGQTAAQALSDVPDLKPDLITMDISLPDKNGLELIKELLSRTPTLLILVFSMHDEALYAERALRAGAKGYLMKGAPTSELLNAIEKILGGDVYLSPGVSQHLSKNSSKGRNRDVSGLDRLTDRELEIFELIGRGKANSQIASQLSISSKTVDAHRSNIKTKLGLPDAPSLMRAAVLWIERGSDAESIPSVK